MNSVQEFIMNFNFWMKRICKEAGNLLSSLRDISYNAEAFLKCLHQVMEAHPAGKVVMVLDNARIHHAKLIQPFLEQHAKTHHYEG